MLCITSVWYFGVWAADTAEFYAVFVFFLLFSAVTKRHWIILEQHIPATGADSPTCRYIRLTKLKNLGFEDEEWHKNLGDEDFEAEKKRTRKKINKEENCKSALGTRRTKPRLSAQS